MTKEEAVAIKIKMLDEIYAQWKSNAEKDGGIARDDLQWCDGCGYNAMIYQFKVSLGDRFQCMCCGSYYGPESIGSYFREEQPKIMDINDVE